MNRGKPICATTRTTGRKSKESHPNVLPENSFQNRNAVRMTLTDAGEFQRLFGTMPTAEQMDLLVDGTQGRAGLEVMPDRWASARAFARDLANHPERFRQQASSMQEYFQDAQQPPQFSQSQPVQEEQPATATLASVVAPVEAAAVAVVAVPVRVASAMVGAAEAEAAIPERILNRPARSAVFEPGHIPQHIPDQPPRTVER